MRPTLTALLLSVTVAFAHAQDEDFPKPSAESQKYSEYRHRETAPLYGLTKVKALIKKLKPDRDDNRALSAKQFGALSSKEKFTYTMLHGEEFSQNCDAMPPIVDEHKKVFAYPPGPFGDEAVWSEQQRNFLTQNRSLTIGMLRDTIHARKDAGSNLKMAIAFLHAKELIPDLVSLYKRDRKDHDLLSVMMVLMNDGSYAPFQKSQVGQKLYGENASYMAYVDATPTLQNQIISQALAFSKSK